MNILKLGVLPDKQTVEMTCSNCNCVFEAQKKEFKFHSDQRDGDVWMITCPTTGCNKVLYNYRWK